MKSEETRLKEQARVKDQLKRGIRTRSAQQRDNATRTKTPKEKKEKIKKKEVANHNKNRSISVMRRKIKSMGEIIAKDVITGEYNADNAVPMFLPVWGTEVLELYILGESVQIIAKRVTKTNGEVKELINSPEGKNYLQKACKLIDIQKVRDEYRGMWFECLQLLQGVVRSNDPDYKQTKVSLAKWFVEISGVKMPDEIKHKHEHILRGVATVIGDKAKQVALKPPQDVIDAQFEVEDEGIGRA